ncbi:hypothetical protein BGZ51_007901 [Haplosporangium sp. Z 767]|nr:hypothetical protein BGZ51_007901 [Haplosporangium sp. Z 767]
MANLSRTPFLSKLHPRTPDDLKKLIKVEMTNAFSDIDADQIILWRVFIPIIEDNDEFSILFDNVLDNVLDKYRKKLGSATRLSKVFSKDLPDETSMHLFLLHSMLAAPSFSRMPLVLSRRYLAIPIPTLKRPRASSLHQDQTRPISRRVCGRPKSTAHHAGSIRGLPSAWRRGFGHPPETRPALLFVGLFDPSTPDSASRNLAAGAILNMVKKNSRYRIPVFGVSGCGKARAVIELLFQDWGLYFNAADDDWGSGDMMALYNTVRSHLKDAQASSTVVDLEVNNAFARKTALLLFLSRLLIFKYCVCVPGSNKTFTRAC